MVFQDAGQLSHGQVADGGSDGLEGSIVGNEDGHVHEVIHGADQVGLGQGTSNGAETSGLSGGSNGLRDGENGIDDVDDTSGEVDVLRNRGSANDQY